MMARVRQIFPGVSKNVIFMNLPIQWRGGEDQNPIGVLIPKFEPHFIQSSFDNGARKGYRPLIAM